MLNAKLIGERIKVLRKGKVMKSGNPMTQQELADTIGVSIKTIRGYEQGVRIPSIDILDLFVTFFKTDADFILYGKNHMDEGKLDLSQKALVKSLSNKLLTIFNESGPLIRIIEIAPTPRAVDIAAIVSSINILLFVFFLNIISHKKKKRYFFYIFYNSFGLITTHLLVSTPSLSVVIFLKF